MKKFEELTFDLDIKQIYELTEHTEIKKYYDQLNGLRNDFEGLWYEIETVHGNWEFKDRVLPPLFSELVEMLTTHLKQIEKFDSHLFGLNIYERASRNHKRKLKSLAYLIKLIPDRLHIEVQPSDVFTHVYFEKTLRVLRKRFLNILDKLIPDVGTELQTVANNELRNQVFSNLEYKLSWYHMPWDPSLLVDEVTNYKYRNAVQKIFSPIWSTKEYYIGMKPLWVTKGGIAAYYFTDNPNEKKDIDELCRIAFISDQELPFLEIFEKQGIEQKAWFENWLTSKEVIKLIIWKHTGEFNFPGSMEEPLSDEQLREYMQIGSSKLQEMVSHYGRIYSPEEFRTYYEEEVEREYEQSLSIDEIREIVKANRMKLFPLIQLQAFLGKEEQETEPLTIEVES